MDRINPSVEILSIASKNGICLVVVCYQDHRYMVSMKVRICSQEILLQRLTPSEISWVMFKG